MIGIIVSPVSFNGEKQLTCLYFESLNPHSKGLMDKGAWRTDKIIFNTDDFDRLAPLLTLIIELKYHGKDKDKVIELTMSYDNVAYRISPSSLVFDYTDELGLREPPTESIEHSLTSETQRLWTGNVLLGM